jgi:hypothetical protein
MAYERRYLPSLDDHQYRDGAFATKWHGWKNPRDRSLGDTKLVQISHWSRIDEDIEDRVGCYAVLYKAGADSFYAAYIGFSKVLGRELRIRYKGWGVGVSNANFPFTAIYIPNSAVASAYEDDLIRYYVPAWNTKFHRQGG